MIDMVSSGRLSRIKAPNTWIIIRILIAKAEQTHDGRLLEPEFDAALRTIAGPLWHNSSLEVELAWSIFDLENKQHIGLDDFHALRAVWASMGKVCSDAQVHSLIASAEEEDSGLI